MDELVQPVATPGVDDPALASWPAEVRQAWAELRLPSLAEQLLAYERLAVEVRRQNQELRRIAAAVQTQPPADDGRLAAALESVRGLTEALGRAGAMALIEMHENCERHAAALLDTVAALLMQPAAHGWFGRGLKWPDESREMLLAQVHGAEHIVHKALAALADTGLHPIRPAVDDVFDPETQRCVDTSYSARPGHIASVERVGWSLGATRIRPPEVVVGKEFEEAVKETT